MQDITRDLFVSLAAFASIFGIIYVFLITRHRERMTLMDKGLDPSAFYVKGKSKSITLKIGMLCVGIALGILAGIFLDSNYLMDRAPAILSMIFLFGGISLILNFIVDRKIKD